jgi:hypothetical protein
MCKLKTWSNKCVNVLCLAEFCNVHRKMPCSEISWPPATIEGEAAEDGDKSSGGELKQRVTFSSV